MRSTGFRRSSAWWCKCGPALKAASIQIGDLARALREPTGPLAARIAAQFDLPQVLSLPDGTGRRSHPELPCDGAATPAHRDHAGPRAPPALRQLATISLPAASPGPPIPPAARPMSAIGRPDRPAPLSRGGDEGSGDSRPRPATLATASVLPGTAGPLRPDCLHGGHPRGRRGPRLDAHGGHHPLLFVDLPEIPADLAIAPDMADGIPSGWPTMPTRSFAGEPQAISRQTMRDIKDLAQVLAGEAKMDETLAGQPARPRAPGPFLQAGELGDR